MTSSSFGTDFVILCVFLVCLSIFYFCIARVPHALVCFLVLGPYYGCEFWGVSHLFCRVYVRIPPFLWFLCPPRLFWRVFSESSFVLVCILYAPRPQFALARFCYYLFFLRCAENALRGVIRAVLIGL